MGMIFNNQTMRYEFIPDNLPQNKANQGLLWVSGEIGAKSWVVPPNQTVLLMDSESARFYIKSSDNAGMPTMKTYEYKEISQPVPVVTHNYDDEIAQLKEKIQELSDKLEDIRSDG